MNNLKMVSDFHLPLQDSRILKSPYFQWLFNDWHNFSQKLALFLSGCNCTNYKSKALGGVQYLKQSSFKQV